MLNALNSTTRSAINQRQMQWKKNKYKIHNMRYKQGFIVQLTTSNREHGDCLEHKGDMSSFWSFGLFGAKSLLLANYLSGAQKFSVIFCCFSGEWADTLWWHVQFCPRLGKKWLHNCGHGTFMLRKFLDLHCTKVTCPWWTHLCSECYNYALITRLEFLKYLLFTISMS